MRQPCLLPFLAAGVLVAALSATTTVPAAEPGELSALEFLRDWGAAWQAQDLPTYLAFYAGDARVGARDRAAHDAHKASLFARGESLEIVFGDVEVGEAQLSDESLLRLSVTQRYSSPSLSDFGRKELLLRPTPQGLRIVRETWEAAVGEIDREHSSQLAAARASAAQLQAGSEALGRAEGAAPLEGQQVEGGSVDETLAGAETGLPPEPVFVPQAPDPGRAEGATQDLRPLPGEGYSPPSTVDGSGAPGPDLLAIEPLVREERPAFLRPLSFPGLPGDIEERTLVEEVVARVNGRVLTRSAFVERLEGQHLQLLLDDPPDMERRLEGLVSATLTQTIERWLLVQEAELNPAEVESYWRKRLLELREQVGANTLEELQELLANEGMTLTTLREQFVANEVVQQRVTARIDRSEARLREYYEEHGQDYAEPARVTLRQILIPVSDPGELARAEAALDAALAQLAEGADFCDVHAVYGQGGKCGDLGALDLGDLLPEMREVAAGLPIGAISTPVRSTAGLHLVQVLARSEVTVPPFEELSPRIERAVIDMEFNRLLEDYLGSLESTAVIEINPRYGPASEAADVGQ